MVAAPLGTGSQFGRMTVVSEAGKRVLCVCSCGVEKEVFKNDLKRGFVKSCGCLGREGRRPTHGHSETPTYWSWSNMIQRCTNPKNHKFPDYGGRGISVEPSWFEFSAFLADMGERPDGRTLDRVDVNGPYSKANCRWSTVKEQNNNRRPRRRGYKRKSKASR